MKIPKFLSRLLADVPHEKDKDELRKSYKSWCDSPITKGFLSGLEVRVQRLILEDEKLTGTSTEFQFKSGAITNRAHRHILREITKELTY